MTDITDILEIHFNGWEKEEFLNLVGEYIDHARNHWTPEAHAEMKSDSEEVQDEFDMAAFCDNWAVPVVIEDAKYALSVVLGDDEKALALIESQSAGKVFTAEELAELASKQVTEHECRFCGKTGLEIEGGNEDDFYYAEFSFAGGKRDSDYFCEDCYWKLDRCLRV